MSRSVWQEPPSTECFLTENKNNHKITSELENKLIILVRLLQLEERATGDKIRAKLFKVQCNSTNQILNSILAPHLSKRLLEITKLLPQFK